MGRRHSRAVAEPTSPAHRPGSGAGFAGLGGAGAPSAPPEWQPFRWVRCSLQAAAASLFRMNYGHHRPSPVKKSNCSGR